MAQQIFKGFKQVVEGSYTAESGYLYFVRKSTNTGKTDGYLQFNGKQYGTGEEAQAALLEKIGNIGDYETVAAYIAAVSGNVNTLSSNTYNALTAETNAREAADSSANTRIGAIEAFSAGTRLSALEASAHTHENKSDLDSITSEKIAAWDAAEANVLEKVQVNGSDLTITNKAVNVTIAQGTANGTLAVNGTDVAVKGLASAAYSEATEFDSAGAAANALTAATAYTDTKYDSAVTASDVVLSAYTEEGVTEGHFKTYEIFQGGASLGKIDIPKDMVVSSGGVIETGGTKYVRLYIANTNPQQHVDIAVSDLAHVYTQGDGIEISSSDVISAKVVAQNGLSVDSNGIKLSVATTEAAGAMSAADKLKLDGVASGAQVNVIEAVQVNGTPLSITGKTVNVEFVVLPTKTVTGSSNGVEVSVSQNVSGVSAVSVTAPDFGATYAPKSLTGTVADNRTAFDNYTGTTNTALGTLSGRVDVIERDYLTSADKTAINGTIGTLSGRVDVLEAISAGTRLTAIEGNVATLSGISADTRLTAAAGKVDALSAVSAETRISALEALTGTTSTALQGIVSGDTSVTIGAKDETNKTQSVAVKLDSSSDNIIKLNEGGLFAAIYYEDNDA